MTGHRARNGTRIRRTQGLGPRLDGRAAGTHAPRLVCPGRRRAGVGWSTPSTATASPTMWRASARSWGSSGCSTATDVTRRPSRVVTACVARQPAQGRPRVHHSSSLASPRGGSGRRWRCGGPSGRPGGGRGRRDQSGAVRPGTGAWRAPRPAPDPARHCCTSIPWPCCPSRRTARGRQRGGRTARGHQAQSPRDPRLAGGDGTGAAREVTFDPRGRHRGTCASVLRRPNHRTAGTRT